MTCVELFKNFIHQLTETVPVNIILAIPVTFEKFRQKKPLDPFEINPIKASIRFHKAPCCTLLLTYYGHKTESLEKMVLKNFMGTYFQILALV